MSWVRRDDQASIHRKVEPLDDATYRMWSEAIEWCSRNQTDGRIRDDELGGVSKRSSMPRAARLVERTLWHVAGHDCPSPKCPTTDPAEPGWVIHDYLEYQPSKEQTRAELAAKAERTRKWRERKGSGDASQADHVSGTRRARDASPSRPVPSRPEGGGDGTSPGLVAAGSAARPDDEPTPTTSASPKCPRCMNPVDSNFHQRVCLPSEESSP